MCRCDGRAVQRVLRLLLALRHLRPAPLVGSALLGQRPLRARQCHLRLMQLRRQRRHLGLKPPHLLPLVRVIERTRPSGTANLGDCFRLQAAAPLCLRGCAGGRAGSSGGGSLLQLLGQARVLLQRPGELGAGLLQLAAGGGCQRLHSLSQGWVGGWMGAVGAVGERCACHRNVPASSQTVRGP